jgi:hypothetical protein
VHVIYIKFYVQLVYLYLCIGLIILSFVLYGCETWFLKLMEEQTETF